MARILITGASGLLGLNLAVEALHTHDVIGVDRGKLKSAPFPLIQIDLLQKKAVDTILEMSQPDWLINCAALANLEGCEENPDQAKILNTDVPGDLALACAKRNIHFIHVSTDAVFDGKREGFYTEQDKPNPKSVYAQTKLNGERAVLDANLQAIIARVNFYGWSLGGQRSLAEFFVNNLSSGRRVNGFTDVIFCPMWVNHLAQTLIRMLEKGLSGMYHVVGTEAMSKYRFGVEVARCFGFQESLISPHSVEQSGLTAKRSHNLWLSTHKLSTHLGHTIPSFSTGLADFYAQFQQGYPQKIRSYQQL